MNARDLDAARSTTLPTSPPGTLDLALRPSRALAVLVVAGHAAACWSAWTGLPNVAAVVVTAGLVASAVQHGRMALQRAAGAVAALRWTADGRLFLADPAGRWQAARPVAWAVPARGLATLVARDGRGALRAALFVPGRLDPVAFRRLRVWLRWRLPATAQDRT